MRVQAYPGEVPRTGRLARICGQQSHTLVTPGAQFHWPRSRFTHNWQWLETSATEVAGGYAQAATT